MTRSAEANAACRGEPGHPGAGRGALARGRDHPDLEAPVHSMRASTDRGRSSRALTDDAPTELTLIDAIDGDLTSVTSD